MVSRHRTTKAGAKGTARRARKLGLKASIHKKKKGYGVSVTRK